jgi:hypothetical protein
VDLKEAMICTSFQNQIEMLNKSFRRTNEDAAETRPEFLPLVGDTKIEFRLADTDPEGNPTSGITRTNTAITHFGGILPYGPGQNALISQWVTDSLIYNYFRLTHAEQGGADAWDTDRYLNVWVGDMRILEPAFDDFEEIVYFGLATPPLNIENWPADPLGGISNPEDGVVMHYVNIGPENPNTFPAPYNIYNGITNTGKMLVHEVGHYLGLRHIWGDGNCSVDDFIADTPNANLDSQWACNFNANTCNDNILGLDLPNMVENYMDYSSADCQNSFTIGQKDLMRSVIEDLRPELAETVIVSVADRVSNPEINIYPNPTRGNLTIDLGQLESNIDLTISNSLGQAIESRRFNNTALIQLDLNLPQGVYILQLEGSDSRRVVKKVIVE